MVTPIYYTYKSAVDRMERFMEKTGIRNYCERYCKGYCCSGCYERDTACHKNEGRRLACSHFICVSLRGLLLNNEAGGEATKYNKLGYLIRHELIRAADTEYENVYFVPYTKKQMNNFRILKSVFDENLPRPSDVTKIKQKVELLTWLAKQIKGAR